MSNAKELIKQIDQIGEERLAEHYAVADEESSVAFGHVDEELANIREILRTLVRDVYDQ